MDNLGLIPEFGGILWTLAAFIVALSVIVAIHEYGHYIVGRWAGIKADVFSLGFGPVLWSRMDRHGTRWQIALLPLGGYVRFQGDSDAASGKDDEAMEGLSEEEARATMHGAPLWARALTVAAGPVFNFILSILIFAGIFLGRGVVSEPLTVGHLLPLPVSGDLRPGDVIEGIGGERLPDFDDPSFDAFAGTVPLMALVNYRVRRSGDETEVKGPYPYPPLAVSVIPQSAAAAIGMRAGDVITAVDNTPIVAFDQIKKTVEESDGKALLLEVWRPNDASDPNSKGRDLQFTLAPRRVDQPLPGGGFETVWRIGLAGGLAFDPARGSPGFGEAAGMAVSQTGEIIRGSISGLWHMLTGAISSCNLTGPIGIAETSGAMASDGAESFVWFIAVLSTAVGLLNLFPVPVLDGGHLCFHAYEAVAGHPPSDGALRLLMGIGLVLILGLMAFALSNDLFCP